MDLGKQVGPLPLGAWFAVIGTGIGVALWARGGGSGTIASEGASPDQWSETDGVGTGVNGEWVDVTPDLSPDNPPLDNDEWGRVAIAGLIATGYDPGLVNNSIGKALAGEQLSVRQYAVWWVALRKWGPPPQPVKVKVPKGYGGNPNQNQPPAQNPGGAGRWVRVTPGMTLAHLHQKYNVPAQRIYEANRDGTKRPDGSRGWLKHRNSPLQVGRRLWIPRG